MIRFEVRLRPIASKMENVEITALRLDCVAVHYVDVIALPIEIEAVMAVKENLHILVTPCLVADRAGSSFLVCL
jgi:hypothetical protein